MIGDGGIIGIDLQERQKLMQKVKENESIICEFEAKESEDKDKISKMEEYQVKLGQEVRDKYEEELRR